MGNIYINVSLDSKLIERVKLDKDKISIGRDSENDIYINNLAISRYHARILSENDRVFLEDLESSNGTYLNGQKITRAQLTEFDTVLIGKYKINIENKNGVDNKQQSGYLQDSTVMVDKDTREKLLEKMGFRTEPANNANPSNNYSDVKYPRLVLSGDLEVEISGELFIIGSSLNSNLYIDGFFIKKKHATIFKQTNKKFTIINSGSIFKPTKINGYKIDQKTLTNGDVIEIGKHKMLFLS
ncbi:MAG: FHA domain-containing protein [Thermodesulfobacteriota bacterium]